MRPIFSNCLLLALPLLVQCCRDATTMENELFSPDKKIRIAFTMNNTLPEYKVWYGSEQIIKPSSLGLVCEQPYVQGFDVANIIRSQRRDEWKPVYGEQAVIPDRYNMMTVELKEKGEAGRTLNIEFRAYDEGLAFRYVFPDSNMNKKNSIKSELSTFHFAEGAMAFPIYETEQTFSNEPVTVEKVMPGAYMPLTIQLKNGFASLFEAHVDNYPPSRLLNDSGKLSVSILGPASMNGILSTPWRGILLGSTEARLIEHEYLVLNLNPPCAIENTSWIIPGKTVSNEGNTPLDMTEIKKLIDLVASLNFKYLQLDWGWYGTEVKWAAEEVKYFQTIMPRLPISWGWHGNERKWSLEQENGFSEMLPGKFTSKGWEENTKGDPYRVARGYVPYASNVRFKNYYTYVNIDMPELINYAKSKGIGIWLYVEAGRTLEAANLDSLFATYRQWGIVGLKPGFIRYGKQENTNWTRKMVATAARHQLMLDIHDGRIPDGLTRTYPNLMNNEGGGGEEGYHPVVQDVMLPFTRCLAGPFDYTPGIYTRGRSYCHMLAFMLVYHCPEQTIRRIYAPWNREGKLVKGGVELEFLRRVPVTWNKTKVIEAQIGNHITVARKHGDSWYVGGITGDEFRKQEIGFDFLDEGKTYSITIFSDDPSSGADGWCPAKKEIRTVRRGDKITIEMVQAGGFVLFADPV